MSDDGDATADRRDHSKTSNKRGSIPRLGWMARKQSADTTITFTRLLFLTTLPIVGLMLICAYPVVLRFYAQSDLVETRQTMMTCHELGLLVHKIQQERDMSIFRYSKLGPDVQAFIVDHYDSTDLALKQLSWPVNMTKGNLQQYSSKEGFQIHLRAHRRLLYTNTSSVIAQLEFYGPIIDVLNGWLYEAIKTAKLDVWSHLVAYGQIVTLHSHLGIERALGAIFFMSGSFVHYQYYTEFNRRVYLSKFLTTKPNPFSAHFDLSKVYSASTYLNGRILMTTVNELRAYIRTNALKEVTPSREKGQQWFDALSVYINIVFEQQNEVALQLMDTIQKTQETLNTEILESILVLVAAIVFYPPIVFCVRRLTENTNRASTYLTEKTAEFDESRQTTDAIIYDMVPRSVAEKLKTNTPVKPEFFEKVTVMFISLANFDEVAAELTAHCTVDILSRMYAFIDQVLANHGAVFKVEAIRNTFMFASGVCYPIPREGSAAGCANLALDLTSRIRELTTDLKDFSLRIGLNTGAVVAGVVSLITPRYCLCGDTVNTASRMESTCWPGMIQISASSRDMLTNAYTTVCRGRTKVKGKGLMDTYWLTGRRISDSDTVITVDTSEWEAHVACSGDSDRPMTLPPHRPSCKRPKSRVAWSNL